MVSGPRSYLSVKELRKEKKNFLTEGVRSAFRVESSMSVCRRRYPKRKHNEITALTIGWRKELPREGGTSSVKSSSGRTRELERYID